MEAWRLSPRTEWQSQKHNFMAISYGELAEIGAMTDDELRSEHDSPKMADSNEDSVDYINAIEAEMEERGL